MSIDQRHWTLKLLGLSFIFVRLDGELWVGSLMLDFRHPQN